MYRVLFSFCLPSVFTCSFFLYLVKKKANTRVATRPSKAKPTPIPMIADVGREVPGAGGRGFKWGYGEQWHV